VLDAAVALADERGLEQVTFARLAETLGVRAPSLYNHVNGRPELLRLITLRALCELSDAIAAAAAGLSGEDALRASARAYRTYALAHPGCYEAIVAAPDVKDAELQAAAGRLLELMAAIMRGWRLDGERMIDAIRTVRSALHGFVSLERHGGFAIDRDPDVSFEALIDTLAAGLAAGPAPERAGPTSAPGAGR
jgi:AcrR family transcriptional regulator